MFQRPRSLAYAPFCPPYWSVEHALDARGDAHAVATAVGLVFEYVVGVMMDFETLEIRWPASVTGDVAVVLFDTPERPIDAFILPKRMIAQRAVRVGDDFVYPMTPERRHHVAVLEEVARTNYVPPPYEQSVKEFGLDED